MAVAPTFRQAFPMPSAPICEPGTGRVTDAWLQFLRSQFMRTGGASGPPLDLSGVANAAAAAGAAATDAAAFAVLADVQQPAADLGPLQAGQADLQALYALHDTNDAPPDLGPVLAAQLDLQAMTALHDAGDAAPALDAALLALVLAD